jgi:hypothetical protein
VAAEGRFHVIDAAPYSPNANGTDYLAIAISIRESLPSVIPNASLKSSTTLRGSSGSTGD